MSHDWGTPRWLKLVALCVHFNIFAATCATMLVSIFFGILFTFVAPGFHPPTTRMLQSCIGFVTFWLFLYGWQQIRDTFMTPRMVFLDKICIPQHDEDLKKKGILGLSTFLDHSKSLTVLWSRRLARTLLASQVLSWR